MVESFANIILFRENGLTTGGGSCPVYRRALLIMMKDTIKKGYFPYIHLLRCGLNFIFLHFILIHTSYNHKIKSRTEQSTLTNSNTHTVIH